MSDEPLGFSTVSMMREEPYVIRRFVEYYLRLGAERIFITYDGPEGDEVGAVALKGLPADKVVFTVMRREDWNAAVGEENARQFPALQNHVHREAQAVSPTEWLLSVDADEFLLPDGAISRLLAAVPHDVASVSVPPAEAVWGPGDDIEVPFGSTHFRRPYRRRHVKTILSLIIYGRYAKILGTNTAGHDAGKHFFRRSVQFDRIGPHACFQNGKVVTRRARLISPDLSGFEVAHFDAIGFDRWVEKFRRRIEEGIDSVHERDVRRRLFAEFSVAYDEFRQSGNQRKLKRLFRRIYGLQRWQRFLLERVDGVMRRRIFGDLPS